MLTFAYQQIARYLKAAAFQAGLAVIEVNAAYTSTIGAVNYAARYGISIHQGAAIALARRGLGLSEPPSRRVAQLPTADGDHVTLHLPARNRSKHVWSLWSAVSRQRFEPHVQSLASTRTSEPAALSFQPQCAS
jgi:hypothetical protein